MLFYIAVSLLMVISSFLEVFVCRKKLMPLFYIISFVLFSVSFLRWNVGTDWDGYHEIYLHPEQYEDMEVGFMVLNITVKQFFDSYTMALFIQGAILFVFQTAAIKQLSPYPMTTLMLLWGSSFCGIFFVRQSVSTAILLFSIVMIRDRHLLAFLVLVFLASLLHRSALFFLPAYRIYHLHFSNKRAVLAIACGMLIGSLIDFADYFGTIGSLLGGMYEIKIDGYMRRGADMSFNSGQTAAQLYIRTMLGRLFLLLLFVVFIKRKYKMTIGGGMLNLFTFTIVLIPIFSSIANTFNRLLVPYMHCQSLLLTLVIFSLRTEVQKVWCFALFMVIIMVQLYMKLFVDYDGEAYLPFNIIF